MQKMTKTMFRLGKNTQQTKKNALSFERNKSSQIRLQIPKKIVVESNNLSGNADDFNEKIKSGWRMDGDEDGVRRLRS